MLGNTVYVTSRILTAELIFIVRLCFPPGESLANKYLSFTLNWSNVGQKFDWGWRKNTYGEGKNPAWQDNCSTSWELMHSLMIMEPNTCREIKPPGHVTCHDLFGSRASNNVWLWVTSQIICKMTQVQVWIITNFRHLRFSICIVRFINHVNIEKNPNDLALPCFPDTY